MAKSSITKTLGPIHFEDLDPRRFEDLVRELAYDFKDWQSIEATGRGGSDDGFDIRAYERIGNTVVESEDHELSEETPHPMEGRVWMFQCKREQEIGPTRVETIISEGIDAKNPPYGYILSAPANFSKASHDKFREKLRKRGVMEFYLWGRAALEDMLHLPKNDHILFTFFGISLLSRRKSRSTEIRTIVNTKNKLFKILGDMPNQEPVLLRDTKDVHYPYKDECKDFKKHPRWKEFPVDSIDPAGLYIQTGEYFAFYDPIKKQWDFTNAINLTRRQVREEVEEESHELRQNVYGFWEGLQKAHQTKLVEFGFVRFDSIVVIDSEGDSLYKFPHIYVEFQGDQGPFSGFIQQIKVNEHNFESIEGLERVKKFPLTFSKPKIGKIYRDKRIELNDQELMMFKTRSPLFHIIYDCTSKYPFLNANDVIEVDRTEEGRGNRSLIKITNKRQELGRDILKQIEFDWTANRMIEEQLGRKLDVKDTITIYEFIRISERQLT